MEWNPYDYLQNSNMQYSIGELALKKLNPQINESILDLGCGIGNLTTKIAEKAVHGKVVGIDVDQNMIKYANSMKKEHSFQNIAYLQIDGTSISYQSEFDAIFSNMVLHWIRKIKKLFEKLYLSLKVGGRVLIATIFNDQDASEYVNSNENHQSPKIKLIQIENRILQNFMTKEYYKDILTLEEFQTYQSKVDTKLTYTLYRVSEFEEMLKKVGFKQIQIDQQIFWTEYNDIGKYFEYRKSLSWLFFLRYFPEKYRPQITTKLCSLILTEWDKIPLNAKEFPIKEKWPVLFIQAVK